MKKRSLALLWGRFFAVFVKFKTIYFLARPWL